MIALQLATLGQHAVKLRDLGEGAWVAVEQESAYAVRLGQPVAHHRVGDRVGDVLPRVHVLLRLLAEGGSLADVGAEDVAGRDRGYGQPGRDLLGLGALPRPGWAEQDQPHQRRKPS